MNRPMVQFSQIERPAVAGKQGDGNVNTKRIAVTVERETRKALFVTDGQRGGWIQRRWLAEDGTVSASTFEKAAGAAEERRTEAEEDRAFRNATHAVPVARETEKAVAAEILPSVPGGAEKTVLAWSPKSQIGGADGVAEIPGWMIREREANAVNGYQPRGYYESHRACKGEGAQIVRGIQILESVIA